MLDGRTCELMSGLEIRQVFILTNSCAVSNKEKSQNMATGDADPAVLCVI